MEHIDVASDARPTAYGAALEPVENAGTQYSLADFLRQFAAVIAICLGTAVLAHILVTISGQY